MRKKILNAIRKNEIKTYLITETVTEGAELYFIRKELDMRRMKKETSAEVVVYRDFEEKLKKIMGTQVIIKNKNNNKGKIEIQYYSQAELERIYDMLKKINE